MKKLVQTIKKIIEGRPSFETTDDINIVANKIENSIRNLSFKEISLLEKVFLKRVGTKQLKNRIRKSLTKIKGIKSKISQKIKAKRQERLKSQIEKRKREAAIDAIPKLRKYHERLDDKELTDRIIKENEEAYSREKKKREQGTKVYQETTIHSTTWINKDPLTPPPTEE
jgi:hypothetical protein